VADGGRCPEFASSTCGTLCVDLETNAANCGRCGKACASSECLHGTCSVCTPDGGCICPTGLTVCDGVCVDTQIDAKNCGGCGVACNDVCTGGACTRVLASATGSLFGIAIDETDIYFTAQSADSGALARVPIDGGVVTTLAQSSSALFVAVDTTRVYWTADDAVMSLSKDGGVPSTLASGPQQFSGVALDSTCVYWTTAGGGTIVRYAIDGGSPSTLATNQVQPSALALGSDSVYWTNSAADGGTGSIVRVSKDGGVATTLVAGVQASLGIAVDARRVYWTEPTAIMAVSLEGGVPSTLATASVIAGGLLGPPPTFALLVVDPPNIFVSSVGLTVTSFGAVYQVPIGGGAATTLAPFQFFSFGITTSATNVYWVAENGVFSHPKP
jgi:hypothetical protein